MDDDELERRLSFSHHGGYAAGLEAAEYEAKRRSGAAYSNGSDNQAAFWRDVHIWLGQMACDARKKQKQYDKQHTGGV